MRRVAGAVAKDAVVADLDAPDLAVRFESTSNSTSIRPSSLPAFSFQSAEPEQLPVRTTSPDLATTADGAMAVAATSRVAAASRRTLSIVCPPAVA